MIDVKNVYSSEAQGASEETKNSPKRRAVDVDAKIIASAYRGYNLCPESVKSNDVKKAFLLDAAQKLHDEQKFYGRFMEKAKDVYDALSDRVSVVATCKEKGIDLMILATHVVFMGKNAIRDVLKYGVGEKSPIRPNLSLYSERFMPDDPQDFVNPAWKPSEHKREAVN